MSYIEPNTTIMLLKGIGIDSSYEHTIYFSTKEQQTNYFMSKKKHSFNKNTYQRVNRNMCKVNVNVDRCRDCNYMMFQNENFSNKWFYAFIDKVEYVNIDTTAVFYHIDIMQTWFFDFTLRECFVEREHVMSDKMFEHRVEEGLETGEFYNLWSVEIPIEFGALVGVIPTNLPTKPFYDYMYTALSLSMYDYVNNNSDAETLHSLINGFLGGENYQNEMPLFKLAPLKCIQYDGVKGHEPKNVTEVKQIPHLKYMGINYQTLKGETYTPRNKKLFTNEFYYVNVRNNLGKSQDYNIEMFTSDSKEYIEFEVNYSAYPSPCVLVSPKQYNSFVKTNYYEGVSYDVFPPIAWVGNTYTQWDALSYQTQQAKQSYNLLATAVKGVGLTALGSATIAYGGTSVAAVDAGTTLLNNGSQQLQSGRISDSFFNIRQNMLSNENKKLKSISMQGSVGEVAVDFSKNSVKFDITIYGLTYEFAKKIDWYFDLYGYKVNTVKVPNINGRRCWNYVKTVGCNVKADSIPNEDVVQINSIFDKGITFWKNGDVICDYADLDNTLPQSDDYITIDIATEEKVVE